MITSIRALTDAVETNTVATQTENEIMASEILSGNEKV